MSGSWKRSRPSPVLFRQSSERNVDGYQLRAEVAEYDTTWSVSGRLAGLTAQAWGHGSKGATLAEVERLAEEMLPRLRAAGLEPDPIWKAAVA